MLSEHENDIRKCNTACTDEYKPLCGYYDEPKDGLTFQNNCVLNTYLCFHDDLPFTGINVGAC